MRTENKQPQPRPSVASMPSAGPRKPPPGDPGEMIRLSHNESGYGPSPKALAAYRANAGSLHRYPDGGQYELRRALAEVHDLDVDRIICGNGSEELLGLLVRAYVGEGDGLLLTENHFIMCSIYGATQGADIILAPMEDFRIDVAAVLGRISAATRMVIIANPGVPAGCFMTGEKLGELHNGLPGDVLLVVDGAYMEYAAPAVAADCTGLARAAENVVMTRTFSKIYGLAGLRIGWAYCPARVIEVLQRIRSPFNANAAALAAACAAVRDVGYIESIREMNAASLRRTSAALTAIGLQVSPSATNFYLVGFAGNENKDATGAADYLRAQNIMPGPVRKCGAGDFLRITVGNDTENDAVIRALTGYMEET